MISSSSKIAVIDTSLGMEVLCFGNRLQMVCALMENARIAPGSQYYGDLAHENAILEIGKHVKIVLKAIAKDRKREADIESGKIKPEQA